MNHHHTLDATSLIHRWNNTTPPRIEITSGDRVTLRMADSSGFQVQPNWTTDDFKTKFDSL